MQRILVTPGEPGGIGPDLVCQIAQRPRNFEICAVADPDLLAARAKQLNLSLDIQLTEPGGDVRNVRPGSLSVLPVEMSVPAKIGAALAEQSGYVLGCLDIAIDACLAGDASAMVTGPISKASIIEAGNSFSGHTEYLAHRTGTDRVVMMLASDKMRVALVTTHLPLQAVSAAITRSTILETVKVLAQALRQQFAIARPVIAVCGLNPHAGEQGHLGREEIETINPACDELRAQGLTILGPLPADTAFTPKILDQADAVLAMFHDQGLPVIKHASFGSTVNVSLGLPIIRTSVDHGTALDIAGTGAADDSSLQAAIAMAAEMSAKQVQ